MRVSLPPWLPYAAGVRFAQTKRKWIENHRQGVVPLSFAAGQRIGKAHRLVAASVDNARISGNSVLIPLLPSLKNSDNITAACERALRRQSRTLLSRRLNHLAQRHGYRYTQLRIKKMRSRCGSCSNDGHISLSLYLIQLPWELIDYVLLHELVHTRHHHHGPAFWSELERYYPAAKSAQRALKNWPAAVVPQNETLMA